MNRTQEERNIYERAKEYYPKSDMSDLDSFRHELRNAYVKGWLECKQQMMKDAVECEIAVAYDNNYGGYTQLVDSKIPLATFGQKVKLIMMKEDSGVADRQKKFFRHHRGGFEDSMRTMVEVGGLDDIRRIVTETSIFKDFYKNIRISGEGVRDERCIPYGWGDTVYFVVADFDGFDGQCIGWTNFKEP